jgi:hypothetical protein
MPFLVVVASVDFLVDRSGGPFQDFSSFAWPLVIALSYVVVRYCSKPWVSRWIEFTHTLSLLLITFW